MSDTDTQGTTDATDASKATDSEVEKWKAMSRKWEERAKSNAGAAEKLAEIENASKSESERLAERIASAERRAEEAERKALRYEVAAAKGVPSKLMRFLQGNSEEELSQSADELLAAVKGDTSDTGDKGSDDGDKGEKPGRPQERLRAGSASEDVDPDESDPAKLAAAIPRS